MSYLFFVSFLFLFLFLFSFSFSFKCFFFCFLIFAFFSYQCLQLKVLSFKNLSTIEESKEDVEEDEEEMEEEEDGERRESVEVREHYEEDNKVTSPMHSVIESEIVCEREIDVSTEIGKKEEEEEEKHTTEPSAEGMVSEQITMK